MYSYIGVNFKFDIECICTIVVEKSLEKE